MDDLNERGRRLWRALLTRDPALADECEPRREIAVSACRTADLVERLERACLGTQPLITRGTQVLIDPYWTEVRKQTETMARALAMLRLPDAASGKRPQRHLIRGAYRKQA